MFINSCECGALIESPRHFFIECTIYAGSKNKMIKNKEKVTNYNINCISFGNKELSYT